MKYLCMLLAGIVASMYLFHFEFVGFEGFNTKRMLAVSGFVLLLVDMSKDKNAFIDRNLIYLSLIALLVSICGFASIVINGTSDPAYATYIGSMAVWLLSAYTVVKVIYVVHGKITVRLICNYFICVCFAQCILAMMIDQIPAFKSFVDTYFELDQKFLDNTVGVKRKYGIGASVDVAGTRFSAVLILLAVMLRNAQRDGFKGWIPFYMIAMFTIFLIGNIISRTTTVGVVLICLYGFLQLKELKLGGKRLNKMAVNWIAAICMIGSLTTIYLYNTNERFEKDIRFGFEGFFSLVERGEWKVSSNDKLKTMYVWPDNAKTWLIGDGYFSNPTNTDPYFIGKITRGYYMGSDAGYVRFVFYFGLFGLAAFCLYFIAVGRICAKSFPKYKFMFYLLVLANFVIWIKVATDIFIVFAPFLCLSFIRDKMYSQNIIKNLALNEGG